MNSRSQIEGVIMPSYCIHVAHGLETLKLLRKFLNRPDNAAMKDTFRQKNPAAARAILDGQRKTWRKQFLAGLIFPDAAKRSDQVNALNLDRMMHYPENPASYFKTPEMKTYLKEHPLDFNSPLYLGYALHLYLDIQYDALLKGMFTIVEFSPDQWIVLFQENGIEVILKDGEFWKQIYEDYTALNPYYIKKYQLSIECFAKPEMIKPTDAMQISWYQKLYHAMEHEVLISASNTLKQKPGSAKNPQTNLLHPEVLNALIHKAAADFIEKYLKNLLQVSCATPVPKPDAKRTPSSNTTDKWEAEQIKLDFYETHWNQLVTEGIVTPRECQYFNGVLVEIKDVTKSAAAHKKQHEAITGILCKLPVLITIFSALATGLPALVEQSIQGKWLIFTFGSVSTLAAACLAATNEYDKRTAHRETWLRQRNYYSLLMDETEAFCEMIGKYDGMEERAAVRKYMNEIRILRGKDYDSFFSNMGYH